MAEDNKTLGALLSDPRIALIAGDAIRNKDLKRDAIWNKTLSQLKSERYFSCDIASGIERLFRAAETKRWYYPLYDERECLEDEARRGTNIVWLPSDDPKADERPFIFLVPGGGFVNVWNLTEGWPIAAQFNQCGYHVFILTYQVDGRKKLLEKNMQDFSTALRFIKTNEADFHLNGSRYITCGFSAGGYLVCLWNTEMGYSAYDLPKPQAVFPVYPVTSLKERIRYGAADLSSSIRLYGCPIEEASKTCYEIPDHVDGFPPCAIFLAAEDELVSPENSKLLAEALNQKNIPCRLEIGPTGGHGFADGSGMSMAGWIHRALRWYESLKSKADR